MTKPATNSRGRASTSKPRNYSKCDDSQTTEEPNGAAQAQNGRPGVGLSGERRLAATDLLHRYADSSVGPFKTFESLLRALLGERPLTGVL